MFQIRVLKLRDQFLCHFLIVSLEKLFIILRYLCTRDSTSDDNSPEQLQQQLEKLRNHTNQLQRDSSKAINRILETPENDSKRSFRPKQNRNREDSAKNEPEQPTSAH